MTTTPRVHPMRFAYEALPRFGLVGNPRVLDILTTPMGQPFLLDIWEQVGGEFAKHERVSPDNLRVNVQQQGEKRIIIVTMPAPKCAGEASMVAFLTIPAKRKMLMFKSEAVMRCFVLEHQNQGSVLWEYKQEGGKTNLGQGPAPSPAAFAAHLEKLA